MATQGLIVQPPKDAAGQKEISDLKNNVFRVDKIKIVTPEGLQMEVPYTIFCLLKEMLEVLSNGDSLTIIPMDKELTTQQAADILNVSRPYFIKLLENNQIPYKTTGKHRKVSMYDLIEYKTKREGLRKDKLNELSEISQELGLYD